MDPKFHKYQVTTGVVFIVFTIGLPWYYGNLATYNSSYFRYNSISSSGDDVDITTWMLSIFFIGMSLGQLLSGSIADRLGLLKTILVSAIIFDTGVFLTYFSVQYSVSLTILTLMAVPGFCCGVIFALSFALVADWFEDEHVGVASAFVAMAFSIGAILYNEMITSIINPDSLIPDSYDGHVMIFFGQQEMMDRYPFVFIPIGVLSVCLQLVGFPLLRTPKKNNAIENDIHLENSTVHFHNTSSRSSIDCGDKNCDKQHNLKAYRAGHDYFDKEKLAVEKNTVRLNVEHQLSDASKYNAFGNEDLQPETVHEQDNGDKSPRDLLKSGTFYVLWLTSFYMALGYLTVNNYYKIFGQLWIRDDNFLTTIGSLSTVTGAISRIMTGLAVDRFGLKNVTVGFTCTSTVALSFWYLSARPDPWLYMGMTMTISAIFSSGFIIFPLGALRYFGRSHYATNYGLVTTSTLLANVFVPLVFPRLLLDLGWFWMFMTVAFLGPVLTVVLMAFLPQY